MRRLLLAAVLVLPTAASAAGLAGSEWRPLTLGGEAYPEGVEATVHFGDEGALSGNGGCNRFIGSYEATETALTIGPVAATRMACPEPAMAAEAELFGVFVAARGFVREGAALTLTDDRGRVIATFAQTDWD